jgi:DNA repair protein RadC
MGGPNMTLAQVPMILRPVIACGVQGFIIMHNHPPGDPTPSRPDRAITAQLRKASEIMQLKFVDHIIIGDGSRRSFSFAEAFKWKDPILLK